MTDVNVLYLIGGVAASIAAFAPILVKKYAQLANAISIVQSFLDLLRTYGKAIADGTISDDECMNIGKDFIALAKVTSLDKTIQAEIPGLEQNMVDSSVSVVDAISKFAKV